MTTILVSLVSEQTIPNILFIKECNSIDIYLFLSSKIMEGKNKSHDIIQACNDVTDNNCTIITVQEDSLQDIERQLTKQSFNHSDNFIVNLTAGTKIMAIGTYDFFKNKNSKMIYIPIGKNEYHTLYPTSGEKKTTKPIDYRIGVHDYLTGYGITIKNPKKINKTLCLKTESDQFFLFYIECGKNELYSLNDLRKYRDKKKVSIGDLSHKSQEILIKCPVERFRKAEVLRKAEVKYLTGEWFEEYVYYLIKTSFNLNEKDIAIGVQIERGGVQNEIDIMFTRENRLYVIECKTSTYDENQNKNILNETLYKISALKKDFGLFVKPYLFTLSPEDKVQENHVRRSDLFGIEMIGREILSDTHLTNKMLDKIKND
ncbi:MAG: DUF1887 family CARF protein [Thermodesulfobacteriota bacterium]|nr:DUF1887 family CARF protein [Thermodesulfobacteriota bacterium]